MMNGSKRLLIGIGIAWTACTMLLAAAPPSLINYQGVLRDSSDAPLDGDHDMVFSFWSHETGGDEVMTDTHAAAHGNAVTVSGGLFNVELGGGMTSDGSGPGAYVNLAHLFRDYGEIWLEIEVDGETLSPRVRVVSAAYAINADHLDGINSLNFMRSNTSDQFTFGTLTMAGGTALQVDGDLQMNGSVSKATTDVVANFNADLLDGLHSADFAGAVHTHPGSDITGPVGEAGNADTLDGHDSSFFLNTSPAAQTKTGPVTVDASAVPGSYGVIAHGPEGGGYFEDSDGSGRANLASAGIGIWARGNAQGGYFQDTDGSGFAYVGNSDTGVEGYGNATGGYFQDLDSSGYAEVGRLDDGIRAYGNRSGGYFEDRDGSSYAYIGTDDSGIEATGRVSGGEFTDVDGTAGATLANASVGIRAAGNAAGGFFRSLPGTGYTHVAEGDHGIHALGSASGGWFEDSDSSSQAYVAHGSYGIDATGSVKGGYFKNDAGTGYAWVSSIDAGIEAKGTDGGGHFFDLDGTARALVAYENHGIEATGSDAGGYFKTYDGSGYAYVGYGEYGIYAKGDNQGGRFFDANDTGFAAVGFGHLGISASGNEAGGYFKDNLSSGEAWVGYGDFGIHAHGDEAGGYFEDSNGSSIVWVGRNDNGISSYGSLMGGYFEDTDNGTVSRIAYGGFGIDSTGTKNFVQNHPYEDDKVIAYSSLEGDEVGTYTRGSARLENGVATVSLGKTFRWVTNPDIGLTVHLTPLGQWSDLYVIEKSTKEITVGSLAGAPDAAFDYIVHGLRIGFEEIPHVREKDGQAFIPSMAEVRQRYEENPALRGFNALERFKKMASDLRGVEGYEPDLDDAAALRAAVQEYDPEIHGRLSMEDPSPRLREDAPSSPEDDPAVDPDGVEEGRSVQTPDQGPDIPLGAFLFPVVEPVEAGDLLVLDPETPGQLRKALLAADPAVIGVVAAEVLEDEGVLQAPVVGTGFAVIKVDASYGAVMAGDLLTSSPTPGHAMTAFSPAPGTVVGKAMEPLEQGTGLIRALVNIQ